MKRLLIGADVSALELREPGAQIGTKESQQHLHRRSLRCRRRVIDTPRVSKRLKSHHFRFPAAKRLGSDSQSQAVDVGARCEVL